MRCRHGLSLALVLGLALAGCGGGGPPQAVTLPQEASYYERDAAKQLVSLQYQQQIMQNFQARVFEPWTAPRPDFAPPQARRILDQLLDQPGVGENLRPRTRAWVEAMVAQCDLELFPSQVYPALTLRSTDLRLLPTGKPVFRAVQGAGNDYPFDRLQESRLPGNTPVQVQHLSRDGLWALVLSHHGIGWMRTGDLAQVKPEQMKALQPARYAAVIREGVKVKDILGRVYFLAGVGTVLPLVAEEYSELKVLAGVGDGEGNLHIKVVQLSKQDAVVMPMPLSPANVANLADVLLGQPYGWGGYLGNRDCSALIKDIFTPFGLWLPRNSGEQAKAGAELVKLSGMGGDAKEEIIASQGVAYASLLWMPGHIMLYLGKRPEGAIVLHSIWAAGAGGAKGQSLPVGRVVISALDMSQGQEGTDSGQGGDLRQRLQGLVQLIPPDQLQP